MIFFYFVLGVAAWTLIEYGMHHWNGHLMKGKTHFSREHLRHHVKANYFSPMADKVKLALFVIGSITLVGAVLTSLSVSLPFALGVGVGYSVYEYVHWSLHMTAPNSWYARWARRHHFSHHFTDARFNHGVTTPVWDIVFRTYRSPQVIRVPRKLAMGWLLDENGDLAEQFASDYQLKGRVSRALIKPPKYQERPAA